VSELAAASTDPQDLVDESEGVLRGVGHSDDSMTPVLQLKGVGKAYRRGDEQVHVLVDFDFTLDAGEFVVVTGPSGAGKSTLLHVAGGLDAPDNGTVAVAGHDVWAQSARRRAAFRPCTAPAGRTFGRTNAKGGGGARAGGPAIHHSR
jgi:ABC-type glutathione transport system ATPase component